MATLRVHLGRCIRCDRGHRLAVPGGDSGFIDRARQTDVGSGERARASKHAAVMAMMVTVCGFDLLLSTNRDNSAQHTPLVVLALTLPAAGLAAVGSELPGAAHAIAGRPSDQRPATGVR